MKINYCSLITALKSYMCVYMCIHSLRCWVDVTLTYFAPPLHCMLTTFPIIDQCPFPPVSSFSQTFLYLYTYTNISIHAGPQLNVLRHNVLYVWFHVGEGKSRVCPHLFPNGTIFPRAALDQQGHCAQLVYRHVPEAHEIVETLPIRTNHVRDELVLPEVRFHAYLEEGAGVYRSRFRAEIPAKVNRVYEDTPRTRQVACRQSKPPRWLSRDGTDVSRVHALGVHRRRRLQAKQIKHGLHSMYTRMPARGIPRWYITKHTFTSLGGFF